ncbi:MAG: hypothetical protein ACTSVI_13325 [Promethearchaeota archaeon]
MVQLTLKRSEDVIIALDFYPKNIKLRVVKQALSKFLKKKHEIDNSDRFNIVLFRGNPSYLEDFTFNKEYILSLIEGEEKNFKPVRVESFIFMALTFLIEVYKKVGNKFFRIIILTDKDMLPIEQEFMVQDLLAITRDMPVYIDVIRLKVTPDKDKNKEKLLKIINWSQGGELIYVKKLKELEGVMLKLAEKKLNEADDAFEEVKELKIDKKYASFYENIAYELEPIEKSDNLMCMACFDKGELLQCPVCGNAVMHKKCWAYWAQSATIGIRHLFRCPICYALLQLPEKFVNEVLGEEKEVIEEAIQNIEVADQTERLMEKDKEAPKLIESLLDQFS